MFSICLFHLQGLDPRLMTQYHADRISEISEPKCRLALDSINITDYWYKAFDMLRTAGIQKRKISSYVLVGYKDGVDSAWTRCETVKQAGVSVNPQWYHSQFANKYNDCTPEQIKWGWSYKEKIRIMDWYYRRRGIPNKIAGKGAKV